MRALQPPGVHKYGAEHNIAGASKRSYEGGADGGAAKPVSGRQGNSGAKDHRSSSNTNANTNGAKQKAGGGGLRPRLPGNPSFVLGKLPANSNAMPSMPHPRPFPQSGQSILQSDLKRYDQHHHPATHAHGELNRHGGGGQQGAGAAPQGRRHAPLGSLSMQQPRSPMLPLPFPSATGIGVAGGGGGMPYGSNGRGTDERMLGGLHSPRAFPAARDASSPGMLGKMPGNAPGFTFNQPALMRKPVGSLQPLGRMPPPLAGGGGALGSDYSALGGQKNRHPAMPGPGPPRAGGLNNMFDKDYEFGAILNAGRQPSPGQKFGNNSSAANLPALPAYRTRF